VHHRRTAAGVDRAGEVVVQRDQLPTPAGDEIDDIAAAAHIDCADDARTLSSVSVSAARQLDAVPPAPAVLMMARMTMVLHDAGAAMPFSPRA